MAGRGEAFIVSACRSAIGMLHGGLGSFSGPQLGALAIKEALKRSGIDVNDIDEVIMGHVVQGGAGQAPARQAAIHGGVPAEVPSMTINKVCGSGLKTVMMAAQSIRAGDQDVIVAGGMESMSQTPYVIRGAKTGTKFGHGKLDDIMISDGLWDSFNNFHMSVEKLARLRPAFQKDGTVTAGNAPGLNDGSAAVVVVSEKYLKENNLTPLAKVIDYCAVGTEPIDLFFSPIKAVRKLMDKMKVDINHWDLIEANEAFSVQALVDGKELGWDWNRVNVHGGAVALGHPIGASGTRILVTLIYALKDRGLKTGLATLCLGGGNAVAMGIELV